MAHVMLLVEQSVNRASLLQQVAEYAARLTENAASSGDVAVTMSGSKAIIEQFQRQVVQFGTEFAQANAVRAALEEQVEEYEVTMSGYQVMIEQLQQQVITQIEDQVAQLQAEVAEANTGRAVPKKQNVQLRTVQQQFDEYMLRAMAADAQQIQEKIQIAEFLAATEDQIAEFERCEEFLAATDD